MTDTPPFDPPYFTTLQDDHGVHLIEILTGGTTREMPAALGAARPERARSSNPTTAKRPAPVVAARKPGLGTDEFSGDRRAAMFLNVPFSEKDDAKKLGARWDGAMRKWFVPHGLDINLFSRWWPEALKQDTKLFGQL